MNEYTSGFVQCHMDVTCTNTFGSFTCECKMGYIGDGMTCSNVTGNVCMV